MKRILVTGGAGFIGSHIVERLISRDYSVRVLDNFVTGKKENLKHINSKRLEIIEGDIRDRSILKKVLKDMDVVCHQAALRSVPRSIDDPVSTNDVNIAGTLLLLEVSRKMGVERFIYASSSSVYGDTKKLPKKEDQLPCPISPYAVSKLTGEYYCYVYAKIFGLSTISLRYFNVFGPRQDPNSLYAAVVPKFILAALKKEPFEIHGDGKQSRDFTFIENVVLSNILAIESKRKFSGEVVNIACNERHSVLEISQTIEKVLKIRNKYKFKQRRTGDVMHTQADIEKSKKLLGYKPTVGFEEGMKITVKYFKQLYEKGLL